MDETEIRSRIVVDTNVLINNLALLRGLIALSCDFKHLVVVPQEVIRELDHLKTSKEQGLAIRARAATNFIFEALAHNLSGILAQRNDEKLDKKLKNDDAILDCCMYFKRAGYTIVLLSNDRNLCVRALTERIPTVTYRSGLEAKQVAITIATEANVDFDVSDVEMMEVDEQPSSPVDTFTPVNPPMKKKHTPKEDPFLPSRPPKSIHSPPEQTRVQSQHTSPIYSEPGATKPSRISEGTTESIPAPRELRYLKYKLVATLENDVFETLSENVFKLCTYRMQTSWTEQEYKHFVKIDPQASTQSVTKTIIEFWFPIFSDYLPQDVLAELRCGSFSNKPRTQKSLKEFVSFWGRVCLALAANDMAYQKMYNNVEKVCSEFYSTPSKVHSQLMEY